MSKFTRRCWVPNCTNSKPKLTVTTRLFGFPRNVKKCREWLKAIGDPALAKCSWKRLTTTRFVCKEHFVEQHLSASYRTYEYAVPIKFSEARNPLCEEALRDFDASVPVERNVQIRNPEISVDVTLEPCVEVKIIPQ